MCDKCSDEEGEVWGGRKDPVPWELFCQAADIQYVSMHDTVSACSHQWPCAGSGGQ